MKRLMSSMAFAGILGVVAIAVTFVRHPGSTAYVPTPSVLTDGYRNLPLMFEGNLGQFDPEVKYAARGNGYTLFLTATETVLSVKNASRAASLRFNFLDAQSVSFEGFEELPGT